MASRLTRFHPFIQCGLLYSNRVARYVPRTQVIDLFPLTGRETSLTRMLFIACRVRGKPRLQEQAYQLFRATVKSFAGRARVGEHQSAILLYYNVGCCCSPLFPPLPFLYLSLSLLPRAADATEELENSRDESNRRDRSRKWILRGANTHNSRLCIWQSPSPGSSPVIRTPFILVVLYKGISPPRATGTGQHPQHPASNNTCLQIPVDSTVGRVGGIQGRTIWCGFTRFARDFIREDPAPHMAPTMIDGRITLRYGISVL